MAQITIAGVDAEPDTRQAGQDTRKRERKPRTASNKVSGKLVGDGICAAFDGISTITRKPWWAIQNRAVEVDPWAADMANILNKIPGPAVDRLLGVSSLVTVAIGMGTLVFTRVQLDSHIKRMNTDPEYARAHNAFAEAQAAPPAPTGIADDPSARAAA